MGGMGKKLSFTLIELLTVVSVIIILLSILLPCLSKLKEVAKRITCLNNQRQLILSWNNYCIDYAGSLPVYDSVLWGDPQVDVPIPQHKSWPVIMQDYLTNAVYDYLSGATVRVKGKGFLICPSLPLAATAYNYSTDCWKPGYGMNVYGIGGKSINGSKSYSKIPQIVFPSRQIGFADSYISYAPSNGNYMIYFGNAVHYRHSGGTANFLFCDGHVESLKSSYIATTTAWGWWNLAPWGTP